MRVEAVTSLDHGGGRSRVWLGLVLCWLAVPVAWGQFLFRDVTLEAGITHGHQYPGLPSETSWMTGGAVAEDFDGDGWVDLYVLQAGGRTNHLYMNQGNGMFVDEALTRGAAIRVNSMGACAADYDNDGDIDICVTRLNGEILLLKNDGAGRFERDATVLEKHLRNGTSPSWGDVDNDGFLELLVGEWDFVDQRLFLFRNRAGKLEEYEFRSGPHEEHYVFSPRFADVNNDGWSDLLVTSDFGNSELYLNLGQGMFERVTGLSGVGSDQNGMGAAVGDYDNDGDLDWFVSSIWDSSGVVEGNWGVTGNRLYRNDGTGRFSDATDEAGVRDGNWGWGSAFGDLDNDGDLDLFHVNGWPEARKASIPEKFNRQPARLFGNVSGNGFVEQAVVSGAGNRGQGRGLILFDFDNDGDLDIFIGNNQELELEGSVDQRSPGWPALLRNDTPFTNHWLKVTLDGRPPLHRDGIGSRVYVRTGEKTQMRELNASTGFLAHGPGRIAHFGLGADGVADEVRAEWVNGDASIEWEVRNDRSIKVRSPVAEVGKRRYLVEEEVTASAMGAGEEGQVLEWVIAGEVFSDPVRVSFGGAGVRRLCLNIYEADGTTLVRSELLRIEVRDFAVTRVERRAEGGGVEVSWETLTGRSYQVEHCADLGSLVWEETGEPVVVGAGGTTSVTLTNGTGSGFYRVRMMVESGSAQE